MPVSPSDVDLVTVLDLAVFGSTKCGENLRVVGKLPNWWIDEIGVVARDAIEVQSPFLVEFLTDADEIWQADTNAMRSSPMFEIGPIKQPLLLQAVAVRQESQKLLLIRNLNSSDSWLRPTLQAARTKMVQHENDRAEHVREVAHITADRDEAQRQERLKSRVLANLSHEIRTPLATILGMVGAAKNVGHAERDEYLSAISSAADQLLALGNDILDLSKIQAERVELDLKLFSFSSFLQELDLQWQTLASQQKIRFLLKKGMDLPDFVVGDKMRLRQILANLIGNALKFTEEGRVSVEVIRLVGTDLVRFAVKDDGVGISPLDLPLIFDSFAQVDASRKKRHEGAGLGLAIAARLVRLMGSEIKVESHEGKGSHFWFDVSLPKLTPVEDTAVHPQGIDYNRCDGIRILVAEDHAVNRSILVNILLSAGASVTQAGNGSEAINEFRQGEFDVVLMDCQMPILNGLAAIGEIRSSDHPNSQVAIIAITAHAFPEEREEIMRRGADHYLSKPVCADELVDSVVRLANRTDRSSDPRGVD